MSTSEILLQERESYIFFPSSEKHSTNDLWAPQELNLSPHDQTWRLWLSKIKKLSTQDDEPDEEVIMTPGDDSKVGEFENSVHDPHDFVGES